MAFDTAISTCSVGLQFFEGHTPSLPRSFLAFGGALASGFPGVTFGSFALQQLEQRQENTPPLNFTIHQTAFFQTRDAFSRYLGQYVDTRKSGVVARGRDMSWESLYVTAIGES